MAPGLASVAAKVSVTGPRRKAPAAGAVTEMTGAVLSRTKVRVTAGAALPAWSTAFTTRVWLPSVLIGVPDRKGLPSRVALTVAGGKLSVAEKVGVTGPRTKLPLAGAVTVRVGAVLSIVKVRVTAAAGLPAASVAFTTRVWGPSTFSVWGEVMGASSRVAVAVAPGLASVAAKVSVTGPRTWAPSAGAVRLMVGAAVSIVKVRVTVVRLPARSSTVTVSVCGPSAETPPPLAIATPSTSAVVAATLGSTVVHATFSVRYTPPAWAGAVMVTTGAVLSTVTVRVAVAALPESSCDARPIVRAPSGSAAVAIVARTSDRSMSMSVWPVVKVSDGSVSRLSVAVAVTSKVPRTNGSVAGNAPKVMTGGSRSKGRPGVANKAPPAHAPGAEVAASATVSRSGRTSAAVVKVVWLRAPSPR